MAFGTALGLGLTVATTVVSLIGTVARVNAERESLAYQAQVAERNREIQLRNSARALETAQDEQLRQDQEARALLGAQVAAQSASGLALEGRSAMLTRKSARRLARQDAENIREAGEIESHNFRMAAEDAGMAAQFARQQSGHALLAGFIEGTGTVLGGIGAATRVPGVQTLIGRARPTPRFAT